MREESAGGRLVLAPAGVVVAHIRACRAGRVWRRRVGLAVLLLRGAVGLLSVLLLGRGAILLLRSAVLLRGRRAVLLLRLAIRLLGLAVLLLVRLLSILRLAVLLGRGTVLLLAVRLLGLAVLLLAVLLLTILVGASTMLLGTLVLPVVARVDRPKEQLEQPHLRRHCLSALPHALQLTIIARLLLHLGTLVVVRHGLVHESANNGVLVERGQELLCLRVVSCYFVS